MCSSFIVRAKIDALGGRLIPLCLFINGVGTMTKQVATLGLFVITLDRFVAIRFPFFYHRNMSPSKVVYALALVWVLSLLTVQLPLLGWNNGWSSTTRCTKRDLYSKVIPDDFNLYVRYVAMQMIPMFVIMVVYLYLFFVIRKHSRQIRSQEQGVAESDNDGKQEKQEFQAARTFALYSVVFICCLFPLTIISITDRFTDVWSRYKRVQDVCVVLTYWVCVLNPLLYLYTNRSLQISFLKCFPFLKPCMRMPDYEGKSVFITGNREATVLPSTTKTANCTTSNINTNMSVENEVENKTKSGLTSPGKLNTTKVKIKWAEHIEGNHNTSCNQRDDTEGTDASPPEKTADGLTQRETEDPDDCQQVMEVLNLTERGVEGANVYLAERKVSGVIGKGAEDTDDRQKENKEKDAEERDEYQEQ